MVSIDSTVIRTSIVNLVYRTILFGTSIAGIYLSVALSVESFQAYDLKTQLSLSSQGEVSLRGRALSRLKDASSDTAALLRTDDILLLINRLTWLSNRVNSPARALKLRCTAIRLLNDVYELRTSEPLLAINLAILSIRDAARCKESYNPKTLALRAIELDRNNFEVTLGVATVLQSLGEVHLARGILSESEKRRLPKALGQELAIEEIAPTKKTNFEIAASLVERDYKPDYGRVLGWRVSGQIALDTRYQSLVVALWPPRRFSVLEFSQQISGDFLKALEFYTSTDNAHWDRQEIKIIDNKILFEPEEINFVKLRLSSDFIGHGLSGELSSLFVIQKIEEPVIQ
jgi:hypothetical protein